MDTLTEHERDCFNKVRDAVRNQIHRNYDTDFNILRFCQSCLFNTSKTIHMLKKHLRFRKEYSLDEGECTLQEQSWLDEYAPWTVLQGNREQDSDRIVVIEQAGRMDSHGVMKGVELTPFMHQRYRRMEGIYALMRKLEKESGRQCFAYFIFDVTGVSYDPTLIPILTGAYRIAWLESALHYRNWIDTYYVVNAPSFVSLFWSAMSPLLGEQTKKRILITTDNGANHLSSLVDLKLLPTMYGGHLSDDVVTLPKKVPKHLYWEPGNEYPNPKELLSVSIPAGKKKVLTFEVKHPGAVHFYMLSHNQTTLALTYSHDHISEDAATVETIVSEGTRASLPSMDHFTHVLKASGFYHLHLANDSSWLLPITVKCLILTHSKYSPENVIPVTVSSPLSRKK